MIKTKDIKISGLPAFLFSFLFGGAISLVAGLDFVYSIFVPSAYRVIYIPAYIWTFAFIFFIVSYLLFSKQGLIFSTYIKKGVIVMFFIHIYLLLGNLIMRLCNETDIMSRFYLAYVVLVFLTGTLIMALVAARFFLKSKYIGAKLYSGMLLTPIIYFILKNVFSGSGIFVAEITVFAIAGISVSILNTDSIQIFSKKFISRDLNIMIFIFVLAFILRATFGIMLVSKTTNSERGYNGYLYASDDALTYDATAKTILNNPGIIRSGKIILWGHWDQFYSVLLAVFYKIIGRNFYLVALFQSLTGSFVPLFIYLTGKELFNKPAAFLAAVLLSFKGGLIMLSSYMGHEAAWLPILCLAIFLLTRYYKSGNFRFFSSILTGITLGILAIFRSMYFYFIPFFMLWEGLFYRKINIVKRITRFLSVGLIALTLIVSIFNYFKNPVRPVNKEKAQSLWYASRLSPPFNHIGNERFDAIGVNFSKNMPGSLKTIAKNPFSFLNVALRVYPLRVIAYFEAYQFGFFDPIYMLNPAKVPNRFASTLEFYFTLFFLFGLGVCIFKKHVLNSPIFMVLIFHILFFSIILSLQAPRLKEASAPFVYLVGSFGAHLIFNFLTEKKRNGGKA